MPSTVLEIIEGANTFGGLLLNSVLLFAIRRFSRASLGTYKHLLTLFAIVDVLLVILQVVVHPRVLRVGNIHATVTETYFHDRRITALYIGCQSVPFTLLGIHFLYRYWSVRQSNLLFLFSNKKFVGLLASMTIGVVFSWYFISLYASIGHDVTVATSEVMIEYKRKYGIRIERAWILFDHWRDGKLDVFLVVWIFFADTVLIGSALFAFSFAFLTFQCMHEVQTMSTQAAKMQRQLLVILCAQASIPGVFVYVPYLICINIPFLGIPGAFVHDITASLFSFFPVWDAIVVILLYPDYRRGLMCKSKKKAQVMTLTSSFQVSTVVAQSSHF